MKLFLSENNVFNKSYSEGTEYILKNGIPSKIILEESDFSNSDLNEDIFIRWLFELENDNLFKIPVNFEIYDDKNNEMNKIDICNF